MKKAASVTIKDIAKATGVTPATVSYILNNKPFSFKDDTKEKVKRTAVEMGYTVNKMARGLVTGRSDTVGIVFLPDIKDAFANQFFVDLISSVCSELNRSDYNIYFPVSHHDNPDNNIRQNLEDVFSGGRVDGVIIIGSPKINSNELEVIKKYRIPSVLIGKTNGINELNMVDTDNELLGFMAVEFLYKAGRKNVCIVGSDFDSYYAFDRLTGAKRAFYEYDKEFEAKNLIDIGISIDDINEAVFDTLKNNSEIDCIFAITSFHAFGAKNAIDKLGLLIPQDIALITVDDPERNNLTNLPLTCLGTNTKKIGSTAARVLLDKMNSASKRSYTQEFLEPELIIKNST